ncbi:MAG: hypothetical protein LBI02_07635 [Opitutaceae bacterium]|nr:hypothetical protein [Opitutaceae bacterium]
MFIRVHSRLVCRIEKNFPNLPLSLSPSGTVRRRKENERAKEKENEKEKEERGGALGSLGLTDLTDLSTVPGLHCTPMPSCPECPKYRIFMLAPQSAKPDVPPLAAITQVKPARRVAPAGF